MTQHFRMILPVLAGFALTGCASGMSEAEIEQQMAIRDARCQDLKAKIDAARGKPLQRDYLLRQYDSECRRP